MTPALEARGLVKRFGALEALGPLDLAIAPGSFVSVLGPSGCGKSTLLRLAAGLDAPSAGALWREGAPLDGPSRRVGLVFQEHVLFPWATVRENVLLPAEVYGLPRAAARARADRLLEMTGLAGFAEALPQALSGGMKQRAAFCRALLPEPELLLLDEPFGALDALTREELSLELSRLWAALGRTALLITHDIEEAILLGDRVVVMSPRPGRILADFAVELPRPRGPETQELPGFEALRRRIRALLFARAA